MPFAELPGELRMHYEDDYLGDPWKTPETVILQHGQAKAAWAWYAWVPLLGRDYRVIRVDARGYGQSSVPPADYQWSLERFAGDLTNLMDHLGIGRAHVIGDTIGGAIALTLAYLHPERLLTVATCQSTFKIAGVGYYQEYVRIVREQGVEAWIRWNDRQADTPENEWYVREMSKTPASTIIGTLTCLSDMDLTPILPKVTVPALTIQGDADKMRLARAKELDALLPNGKLAILPGVSRATQTAPEASVAAWREFVRGL